MLENQFLEKVARVFPVPTPVIGDGAVVINTAPPPVVERAPPALVTDAAPAPVIEAETHVHAATDAATSPVRIRGSLICCHLKHALQ